MSDAEDHDLVVAAQRGDRDALDTLLRHNYDAIHSLCRRMLGNDADGKDATQESLIAIVRGIGKFDGRSRFSTWVHRVTVNACIDEIRRRQRRPSLAGEDGSPFAPADPSESQTADRLDIDRALRQLPVEFRAPVVLRDLCGLDYDEISAVLSIPPGTVRSRIARGRAALVPLLQPGNLNPTDDRPTPQP